jgi:hypothetical protein
MAKQEVVFRAGAYLLPFSFGMLIATIVLYRSVGPLLLFIFGTIFYLMLSFLNSLDRHLREIKRK